MTPNIETGVGGFFRLVATKPDGTQRVLADWFPNLITDIGLDRMGARDVCCSYVMVGTSSTPPSVTDTALLAQVAFATSITGSLNATSVSAPYYGASRNTWRFAAGVATGALAEIGVGWGSTNNMLFSRSLIKNSEGDPITVTVLPDEVLDVTYELRLYAPSADVTFDVTISGATHSCVLRATLATTPSKWCPGNQFGVGWTLNDRFFAGDLGAVTEYPSGVQASSGTTIVPKTYVTGSHELEVTIGAGLPYGNLDDGIKSLTLESGFAGSYQCSFNPVILKDANKVFSIDAKFTWARYTP